MRNPHKHMSKNSHTRVHLHELIVDIEIEIHSLKCLVTSMSISPLYSCVKIGNSFLAEIVQESPFAAGLKMDLD